MAVLAREQPKQNDRPSGPHLPQCSPVGAAAAAGGRQDTLEHPPSDAWQSPRSGPGSPRQPLGEAGDSVACEAGGSVACAAAHTGGDAAGDAAGAGADAAGGLAGGKLVVETADLDVGASRGEAGGGGDEMAQEAEEMCRAAELPPAACRLGSARASPAPSSVGHTSRQEDSSACSTQPSAEILPEMACAGLAPTHAQASLDRGKLPAVGPEPPAVAAGESTRPLHDTPSQRNWTFVSEHVQEDGEMALSPGQAASITYQGAEVGGAAGASCAVSCRTVQLGSVPAPRPPGSPCAIEVSFKGISAAQAWPSEAPAPA